MNTSGKVLPLARLCTRQLSKTNVAKAAENIEEVPSKAFHKLKETQKKFGIEDGVPVHLKSGFTDRILYLGTSLGVLVGLGLSGEALYRLSTK